MQTVQRRTSTNSPTNSSGVPILLQPTQMQQQQNNQGINPQQMTILRQPPPGFVSVLVPIVSLNYENKPSSPSFIVGSIPSCVFLPPQSQSQVDIQGLKSIMNCNGGSLKQQNNGRLSPLQESEEFPHLKNSEEEVMPSASSSGGEASNAPTTPPHHAIDMGTQTTPKYDDSDEDIRICMKEERLKRRKKLLALKNRPPKITILKSVKTSEGVKLECEMETAKKQLVLFEFSTEDVVPEDVAAQFISGHLMQEKHKPFVIETLNQIICQHKS